MSRKSTLEQLGGPITGKESTAPARPKNTEEVLRDLQKADGVISQAQPAAASAPAPKKPAKEPEPPAASVEAPEVPAERELGLQEILAIRKANAKEHTLQRNYRMPVSLLADMDTLQALGYEFSAMVVAGTRAQVAELKKKHGLK